MSLVNLYEKLASIDQEIAAQQEQEIEKISEVEKVAAEYDAAGRIMARGFLDELNKLAEAVAGPKPTMSGPQEVKTPPALKEKKIGPAPGKTKYDYKMGPELGGK